MRRLVWHWTGSRLRSLGATTFDRKDGLEHTPTASVADAAPVGGGYSIGYVRPVKLMTGAVYAMHGGTLLEGARRASGLSQGELAVRAGTSRPTLSAFELSLIHI